MAEDAHAMATTTDNAANELLQDAMTAAERWVAPELRDARGGAAAAAVSPAVAGAAGAGAAGGAWGGGASPRSAQIPASTTQTELERGLSHVRLSRDLRATLMRQDTGASAATATSDGSDADADALKRRASFQSHATTLSDARAARDGARSVRDEAIGRLAAADRHPCIAVGEVLRRRAGQLPPERANEKENLYRHAIDAYSAYVRLRCGPAADTIEDGALPENAYEASMKSAFSPNCLLYTSPSPRD